MKISIKKIIPIGAFMVAFAFTMTTIVPVSLAAGKGHGNSSGSQSHQTGKAYGHFTAPGWLKKHDRPSTEGVTLPRGIAKKLNQSGGPGHHDIVAPTISDLDVTDTDTTATITWNTDEPAKSTVFVSTASPVDPSGTSTLSVTDANLVTAHTAVFTGLTPSTMYHMRIKVTDAEGNTRMSSELSFSTNATPDVTGPVISDLVTSSGTTTATTTWTTNELATTVGYISTTTGFGIADPGVTEVLNVSLVSGHSVSFAGLTASTTYYARVKSVDASTNATLSNEISFTTL